MSDNNIGKLSIWLEAMRLRTLPLSVAGIITGTALAFRLNEFKLNIFLPAISTTLLLQILSNFANDYGDAEKGTDGKDRIGPLRMVQSGLLKSKEILSAIVITAFFALLSGIFLLYQSFDSENFYYALMFFLLGILSIWAALKYTIGNNAYGYYGLGDLFVMTFFGLVSVTGSFFLFTEGFSMSAVLQAVTIGLFSTGVLHLNNMRDQESDKRSGKITMAVKLGDEKSKKYFYLLMIIALLASVADVALTALHFTELIQLIIVVPIVFLVLKVSKITELKDYNNLLKPLALSTFAYSILLFISFII